MNVVLLSRGPTFTNSVTAASLSAPALTSRSAGESLQVKAADGAGSFSQTYLRNAYNNGFVCIELPALLKKLREQFATEITAKEKTIIPGDSIDIDFTTCSLRWRSERFSFTPLGKVPQSLVIAGGAENVVTRKLGLLRKHPELVVSGD